VERTFAHFAFAHPRAHPTLRAEATSQTMTTIEYKGYRIEVSSIGKGWRASIFSPGSTRALADSPSNLEKSRTEEIVTEAKRIIDAQLNPRVNTEK
jgi:hypothetical protein